MAQAESLNLGSARSSSLEDDSGSIQGRQNAAQNIDLLAAQLGNTPATIRKHYAHLLGEHGAIMGEIERVRGT